MSDLCLAMEKFGKGIGNASRYRIVQALLKGPKTVGEIVRIVKKSQPAVSQHLKTLRDSGLILDERRGQEVLYSINTEYILGLLTSLSKDICKTKQKKPARSSSRCR